MEIEVSATFVEEWSQTKEIQMKMKIQPQIQESLSLSFQFC